MMLHEDPRRAFGREVLQSGLLSRAWVYQEILLTPASLFCSTSQMWWACAHASRSQAVPPEPLDYFHIGEKSPRRFLDDVQQKKHGVMTRKESSHLATSWASVLSGYARTAVTFSDDRLVALGAIATFFRSLYPDQLRKAEYHSGLWSTHVLPQLTWRNDPSWRPVPFSTQTFEPPARRTTKHPIPTWSPLRESRWLNIGALRYSPETFLPNKFISMNTSRLDDLGRATDWRGCEMHLQGALVHITYRDADCVRKRSTKWRAHPTGHKGLCMPVIWDNEDGEASEPIAPRTPIRALLIVANVPTGGDLWIHGILLQALTNIRVHPERISRWARCGSFWETFDLYKSDSTEKARTCKQTLADFETAWKIPQNYAVTWELENPEEKSENWRWRHRRLREPNLEDIYIY